jgi:hypothetical protein
VVLDARTDAALFSKFALGDHVSFGFVAAGLEAAAFVVGYFALRPAPQASAASTGADQAHEPGENFRLRSAWPICYSYRLGS